MRRGWGGDWGSKSINKYKKNQSSCLFCGCVGGCFKKQKKKKKKKKTMLKMQITAFFKKAIFGHQFLGEPVFFFFFPLHFLPDVHFVLKIK